MLGSARIRFYFSPDVELQAYHYVGALLAAGHTVRVVPTGGMRMDAKEFWPSEVFMGDVVADFINVVCATAASKMTIQAGVGELVTKTTHEAFWTAGHVNVALTDKCPIAADYAIIAMFDVCPPKDLVALIANVSCGSST